MASKPAPATPSSAGGAHQAGTQQAGAGGPVKTGGAVGAKGNPSAHAQSVLGAHQQQAKPSPGAKSGQPNPA